MFRLLLCLCIAALCISSCAVIPFKMQKVDTEFNGIDASLKDKTVNDIRILIVHGVGPQEYDYADKFIDGILNLSHVSYREVAHFRENFGYKKGSVDISSFSSGSNSITFYAVYWSDITEDMKLWLEQNHKQTFGRRTIANNNLKRTVLNNNLSDFVLYTSLAFRDNMQDPIRKSLRLMYGIDSVIVDGFDYPLLNRKPDQSTDFYIVTGSLGTRITFDVLDSLKSTQTIVPEQPVMNAEETIKYEQYVQDKAEDNSLANVIETYKIQTFYSMSNQIPLLSLRDLADASDTVEIYNFKAYLNANYRPVCDYINNYDDSVLLVAFYDPNDLLGYRMIKPPLNEFACDGKLKVVTCLVNNTPPLLAIFASPRKAHTGGWNNKKTIQLILYGYHKNDN